MLTAVIQLLVLTAVAPQLAASPALITVVAPFKGDPSTLTAAVLGVDSLGRTTYAIDQNVVTVSLNKHGSLGTLVEGSDYISYAFSRPSASMTIDVGPLECTLSVGNAICTDLDDKTGDGDPHVETTTLSSLGPWVLDLVSTAGTTRTAVPSGSTTTAARSGSSTPSAASSSSAPTSTPTTKANSAQKVSASLSGALNAQDDVSLEAALTYGRLCTALYKLSAQI
ncbi:hypothetical protein C8R44DRAFT_742179 [Mycena epipterygia]|nr:hypothetical protein C8R44DRAFT_742179 [Mycena epipterygia]